MKDPDPKSRETSPSELLVYFSIISGIAVAFFAIGVEVAIQIRGFGPGFNRTIAVIIDLGLLIVGYSSLVLSVLVLSIMVSLSNIRHPYRMLLGIHAEGPNAVSCLFWILASGAVLYLFTMFVFIFEYF